MEHQPAETCDVCGMVPVTENLTGNVRVVAASPLMHALLRKTARFAASEAPVAITGETGTGKEVIARMIHRNSTRAERPFVAVNVAALPAALLESELFGHGKGAFTGATSRKLGLFEEADGGTLFLDEISEMALPLQAKLLRVLQDGEVRRVGESRPFAVDVRVLSATHRDSLAQVRSGEFREDLHYRLHVLILTVPPLRQRREDIVPLAEHFLAQQAHGPTRFDAAARKQLLAHDWPGNVRELHNVVRHGAALAIDDTITVADLPDSLQHAAVSPASAPSLLPLEAVEREHILRVLDHCNGSQAEAARVLGIARNTLWRKLRDYT